VHKESGTKDLGHSCPRHGAPRFEHALATRRTSFPLVPRLCLGMQSTELCSEMGEEFVRLG